MTSIDQVGSNYQAFKAEFEKPNADLDRCADMLADLKISLTQFNFLFPGSESPDTVKQAILSREILEHAILLAVKQRDSAAFARQIAQVKTYYFDTNPLLKKLPLSTRQYPILGLNLLRLLASNRIAEFHTELELIPYEQHENVYIKHPIQLEQYIMEGSYNKVYNAARDLPSESYSYFIESLIDSRLKDEIAECSEKSYSSLSVNEARRLLHFDASSTATTDDDRFLAYAKERGWQIAGDRVHFQEEAPQESPIPSMNVINLTLAYAKELERIV